MTLSEALTAALSQDWIGEQICATPDKYDGAPVFKGTAIPVYAPLDLMAEGARTAEILDEFPGLTKDHIKAALSLASEILLMASVSR